MQNCWSISFIDDRMFLEHSSGILFERGIYMSLNLEILGKRIKARRCEKGISQAYLAEMAGLEPSYVSIIERGKKQIGLDKLVAVASALGTTLDDLLIGNQICDNVGFYAEMENFFSDCTLYERRILTDVITAVKESIRRNIDVTFDENNGVM